MRTILFAPIVLLLTTFLARAEVTATVTIDWKQFESAVILKTYRGNQSFICSAVLINPTTAISTAHCVEHSDKSEVIVGISPTDPEAKTFEVDHKSIRINPSYQFKKSLYHGDIATFHLKKAAPLTHFAKIPKLSEVKISEGMKLDRIGFGLRNKRNLRTWTEVFFNKKSEQTLFMRDELSVIGDSGGPIFLRQDDTIYLLGIHSTSLDNQEIAAPALEDYQKWLIPDQPANPS